MQTTLRSTGFATCRLLTHCKSVYCSGVHLVDVSIRSRLVLFVLVTHLCCRYEQFETCGSTLTQMSPWVLTSLQSSKHVLEFYILQLHSTPSNTQCASSFADTYHLVDTSACTCGDKGGLLQLSSLGYFRTTVTTAAVCLQPRRSSRVLCKKVGAHNSTSPWTTLAESSRENSVPVMCSCVISTAPSYLAETLL